METVWHRIDYTIFERLVTAAQNHFARQCRYVDPDAVPEKTIVDWLNDLERARTAPSPTPEPGDLLVKQARGEQWMLTSGGWRELAPLELQEAAMSDDEIEAVVAQGGTVQARKGFTFDDRKQRDPFPPGAPREFQDGDPMLQPVAGVAPRYWGDPTMEPGGPKVASADEVAAWNARNIDRDARAGAGGVCGRHGVYSGVVCPTCKSEAAEQVVEISGRIQAAEAAQGVGSSPREFPVPVKRCLADLLELENAIDVTLEATADTDLAAGATNTLRSFKDGVDTARKLLLDTATRELRSQP